MKFCIICTKKKYSDCKSKPTLTRDYNASILDCIQIKTGLFELELPRFTFMIQLTPYHVPTNPMIGVRWHVWHGHVDSRILI